MCKNNIPTIEERNYNWLHNHKAGKGDELDLIVNVQLMPEWEARGFITKDVEAFRDKMNEEDLPGESAVLGTHKPGDRATRRKATAHAGKHHEEMMEYAWSYEPIFRGENGKYNHLDPDKWESSIVATKKKSKSEAVTFFNRVDRRKSRHEGKAECGRYTPEMFGDDFEDEELREIFPEKADGTIDLDAYLAEEEYSEWYDSYWELEDEEDLAYEEISRLKREISTYRDFIGEYNLGKLYQTWLAQNGKGRCNEPLQTAGSRFDSYLSNLRVERKSRFGLDG